MLSRETARLKNKLTGSAGRKHAREEDRSAVTVPSDDEEESRAGAIRKKAKVDPFEKLKEGKGKKKKDQSNEMSVESGVSMALNPDQSSKNDEVSGNTHGITLDEQQDKQHSGQSDLLNYVLGKKKRQKLMKDSVVNLATSPAPSSLNVIASAAASISGSCNCAEMSHDLISNPKHKGTNSSGLTQLEKSPSSDITRKTITAGIESTVLSISASPIVKSTSKSITVSGLPLLNLNGPPGQPEDAAILSSKKKRKRRKKKKKSLGDVVNAEDEPNGKVS
ncbi:hypothetical protein AcW1_004453 [Taiwanofungus camphoratus]|nr:hypothetical protein AcV5_000827 [Antrodia cinnamomea]KAI0952321.1 hypothetical protein AcV7_008168 [Antrodia cinnamomea]KAI0959704.1 hypothetical protein AcW1_004453 [Antrodia cinnamomea]